MTMSGTPLSVSEGARVPVVSLSNIAAHSAHVKSPRGSYAVFDDSHGAVPAAGTSALSMVRLSQVLFLTA